MDGFFYKEKVTKVETVQREKSFRQSTTRAHRTAAVPKVGCEACGLYKGCKSSKMPVSGRGRKGILCIAEAPGGTEDERNEQLVGKAGQLYSDILSKYDIALRRDCYKYNTINCRPPGNREPSRKEIKCCRPNVLETINKCKPKMIWLLGKSAVEGFFMERFRDLSITRWRGLVIPHYEYNCWVTILHHPSYLLRNRDEKLQLVFESDIANALTFLDKPLPPRKKLYDNVVVLKDYKDIVENLRRTIKTKPKKIIFDYETNRLNPHKENRKIHTISYFAKEIGKAVAFPLDHPGANFSAAQIKTISDLWVALIDNAAIKKVAQNLKFEFLWTWRRFNVCIRNWVRDTMSTSHILDDRRGATGLKFQAFIRWGTEWYEKDVEKYIEAEGDDGCNLLHKVPVGDVCLYNGCDSYLTNELAEAQENELKEEEGLQAADDFTLKGILAFCEIEQNGIRVDLQYYRKTKREITDKINVLEKDMLEGREARLFKRRHGRAIKLSSPKDISTLLFTDLGIKSDKLTASGAQAVDVKVLSEINHPFTNNLIISRRLLKIRDTYIAQIEREQVKGRIYPSNNLHLARSYRSSNSNPNMQNIPVREEEAKRTVRKGIKPSFGRKIRESDYKAIEVRIAACYTQDPKLIAYIEDPSTDMHRDQAIKIFKAANDWAAFPEDIQEKLRYNAKNKFVFPEFYGSYFLNCAKNLWEAVQDILFEGESFTAFLASKGLGNLTAFTNHVKRVENEFWDTFSVFRKWQDKTEAIYREKGYVEFLFGHRRGGYLTRNQLINSPIQGAAFHCLLWSLTRVREISRDEQWETFIIGQIHDSMLQDQVPEEEQLVAATNERVMTKDIRERFPSIIVPLEIEAETTGIDEGWYGKKKQKKEFDDDENGAEDDEL